MSDFDHIGERRLDEMLARQQNLPNAIDEQRQPGAATRPRSGRDGDPLCRLSALCGGILPLLGSLAAVAALATVAVMA